MRSRERLGETLRSINVQVFEQQVITAFPLSAEGWREYLNGVAFLVEREKTDSTMVADLYLVGSASPHYRELLLEARTYLGLTQ